MGQYIDQQVPQLSKAREHDSHRCLATRAHGGDEVRLGRYTEIIRLNEINSIPDPVIVTPADPRFILGDGSIITASHKIDFTDRVEFGKRVILGGRNSSLWTHNRQATKPIIIGDYSYIGSEIRIAPGGEIPPKCIVGIGSVITKKFEDEYFLIAFNSRAQLLLDRTRDGESVLQKLTLVQPRNNTALYDACYLGIEKVTTGTRQKKALLIISDGQDNASRYNFGEVRRLLKESDVTVYAVGILDGRDSSSVDGLQGQAFLDELTSITGGKAFYPQTDVELDEIFERIALELRHQYSIGYTPDDFQPDGKWHKVKTKVKPPRGLPRLTIRGREGYYASPTITIREN